MATIINAVSGTGLTQSADGSGVLKVQSNGVTTNALAWVNFNGVTTATIRASFNVSSVTRNAAGSYTVNFTSVLSDANYVANISSSISSGGLTSQGGFPMELLTGASTLARTASAFPFLTLNSSYNLADAFSISVSIFGN
jgi:hypothetical protein